MADQTKNTHDRPQKTNEHPHIIPAEPLGTGAPPMVSPGCDKNPGAKRHPLTQKDVAEAMGTRL